MFLSYIIVVQLRRRGRRLQPWKNTLRTSLADSSGAHSVASHVASVRKHSKLGKVRRDMQKITTQERRKSIEMWSRSSHFCIKWPSMREKNTLYSRFVRLGRSEVVLRTQYTSASTASAARERLPQARGPRRTLSSGAAGAARAIPTACTRRRHDKKLFLGGSFIQSKRSEGGRCCISV